MGGKERQTDGAEVGGNWRGKPPLQAMLFCVRCIVLFDVLKNRSWVRGGENSVQSPQMSVYAGQIPVNPGTKQTEGGTSHI